MFRAVVDRQVRIRFSVVVLFDVSPQGMKNQYAIHTIVSHIVEWIALKHLVQQLLLYTESEFIFLTIYKHL
jgi:hypothetical protein